MTINEIRHHNLELLIAEYRTIRALAEQCNINDAYLSQVRNALPDSRNRTPRNIGDEIAQKLETHTGKPKGWMDTLQHHDQALQNVLHKATEPKPERYLNATRERLLLALDDLTGPQVAELLKQIEQIARTNREIESELSARKRTAT